MPFAVLAPRVRREKGVLVLGLGLDVSPVAVEDVLAPTDEAPCAGQRPFIYDVRGDQGILTQVLGEAPRRGRAPLVPQTSPRTTSSEARAGTEAPPGNGKPRTSRRRHRPPGDELSGGGGHAPGEQPPPRLIPTLGTCERRAEGGYITLRQLMRPGDEQRSEALLGREHDAPRFVQHDPPRSP